MLVALLQGMASIEKAPAEAPTDLGRHLLACRTCKLLKSYEQVSRKFAADLLLVANGVATSVARSTLVFYSDVQEEAGRP